MDADRFSVLKSGFILLTHWTVNFDWDEWWDLTSHCNLIRPTSSGRVRLDMVVPSKMENRKNWRWSGEGVSNLGISIMCSNKNSHSTPFPNLPWSIWFSIYEQCEWSSTDHQPQNWDLSFISIDSSTHLVCKKSSYSYTHYHNHYFLSMLLRFLWETHLYTCPIQPWQNHPLHRPFPSQRFGCSPSWGSSRIHLWMRL